MIRGPAENVGDTKIDAAKQMTRFLLDSQEDKHGLSSWIELAFGEDDIRRLDKDNWSVPPKILDLSQNLSLLNDEEVLESTTGNDALPSAPTNASYAIPPKPEAPSRPDPQEQTGTPAHSTLPHRQTYSAETFEISRSAFESGRTSSVLEPDSSTPQEIDPVPREIAKNKELQTNQRVRCQQETPNVSNQESGQSGTT